MASGVGKYKDKSGPKRITKMVTKKIKNMAKMAKMAKIKSRKLKPRRKNS